MALLTAARLAESSGAPLVVLHVIHEPGNRPGYYRRQGRSDALLPIDAIAERALQGFLSDVRAQHPEHRPLLDRAEIRLVAGIPETRIPEVARSIGAQLILMGSNGRGSLARLFGGSISDRVAHHGSIPVTVVNARPEAWGLVSSPTNGHRATRSLA